jgi:hypothetical protein
VLQPALPSVSLGLPGTIVRAILGHRATHWMAHYAEDMRAHVRSCRPPRRVSHWPPPTLMHAFASGLIRRVYMTELPESIEISQPLGRNMPALQRREASPWHDAMDIARPVKQRVIASPKESVGAAPVLDRRPAAAGHVHELHTA